MVSESVVTSKHQNGDGVLSFVDGGARSFRRAIGWSKAVPRHPDESRRAAGYKAYFSRTQADTRMSADLQSLHKAILKAMSEETRRIVDEEAKNAAKRVEERVRAQAGQIATQVASFVMYERGMNEVRISVRLPDRDNK